MLRQMKSELYDFKVTPICFLTGERTVTILPKNERLGFEPGRAYTVDVLEASRSPEKRYPGSGAARRMTVVPDGDGALRVRAIFEREGMYLIKVYYDLEAKRLKEFRVYALERDMKGLYPYRGDLHMHTCRSDGREDPFRVCANYRKAGYDFTIISDHNRYYPSLEARNRFQIGLDDRSPVTDMLILPGEEVHLPLNDAHYINCGGSFSVNALVTPNKNQEYAGDDPAFRSLDGKCPPTMTKEEYEDMIRRLAKDEKRALESERLSIAATRWIYEKVREADGLAIFPHPYWLCDTMQLSEDFLYWFYEQKPFDAFEVLGGEIYYQHNGFQTAFYYENRARGLDYPVVGSTDSHGSTPHNPGAYICSTIIMAPENTTKAVKEAVKAKRSVAVDTISAEYRLVGDFRLVKLGSFLLENWYPIHDMACEAEGYIMDRWLDGDPAAAAALKALKGQVPGLIKEYFETE